MRSLLLLLLCVSFSNAAYPFVGEILDYEVNYAFKTLGNASMQVKGTKNLNELEIITGARNNFLGKIYPVNDSVKSIVSADSLFPKVFSQKLSERRYRRNALVVYDFEAKKAIIKDTAFKVSEYEFLHGLDTAITLNGKERCILSAFYFVRTLNMKPGDTIFFDAISGVKKYKLKVICHKKETIKTALGKKDCIVIEPVIQGDGLFNAKGKLTIWLTDDAEHIPVLMKSKILLGSIEVALVGVKKQR